MRSFFYLDDAVAGCHSFNASYIVETLFEMSDEIWGYKFVFFANINVNLLAVLRFNTVISYSEDRPYNASQKIAITFLKHCINVFIIRL